MSKRELPNIFSTSAVDMLASSLGAAAILFAIVMTNSGGEEVANTKETTAYFQLRQFGKFHFSDDENSWLLKAGKIECSGKLADKIEINPCSDKDIRISRDKESVSIKLPTQNNSKDQKVIISYSSSEAFAGEFSVRFENMPNNTSFKMKYNACCANNEAHYISIMSFDRRGIRKQKIFWQDEKALEIALKNKVNIKKWEKNFRKEIINNGIKKLKAYTFIGEKCSNFGWININITKSGLLNVYYTNGLDRIDNNISSFSTSIENWK